MLDCAMAFRHVKGGQKLKAWLRKHQSPRGVKDVEIGFFETAKYPNGTSVAAVAAFNEFGTVKLPERAFFRTAIKKAPDHILSVLKANLDPRHFLIDAKLGNKLGLTFQAVLRQSITEFKVIDTGHLRRSADYRLID